MHRLLAEYFEHAPASLVADAAEYLSGEPLLHIVHTKEGAQAACAALAYGTGAAGRGLGACFLWFPGWCVRRSCQHGHALSRVSASVAAAAAVHGEQGAVSTCCQRLPAPSFPPTTANPPPHSPLHTAKDRKKAVRALKGHVGAMARDEWGHLPLITALAVVDDTALLRKAVLPELQVGRGRLGRAGQ